MERTVNQRPWTASWLCSSSSAAHMTNPDAGRAMGATCAKAGWTWPSRFPAGGRPDPRTPTMKARPALAKRAATRCGLPQGAELNPYYMDVRRLARVVPLAIARGYGSRAFNVPRSRPPDSARNLGQSTSREELRRGHQLFRTSLNRNKAYSDAYLGRPTPSWRSAARTRSSASRPGEELLEVVAAAALGQAYLCGGSLHEPGRARGGGPADPTAMPATGS
jgi:hypothetical protein